MRCDRRGAALHRFIAIGRSTATVTVFMRGNRHRLRASVSDRRERKDSFDEVPLSPSDGAPLEEALLSLKPAPTVLGTPRSAP